MTEKAAFFAAFFAFVSDCISVIEKLIAIFCIFSLIKFTE